jgi:hypothetical protein
MSHYPALKSVIPLDGYLLELTFAGGERRIYDFKPNLSHKFYHALHDVKLFNSVSVDDGEIAWPTGQDFCPHTLYEESSPLN